MPLLLLVLALDELISQYFLLSAKLMRSLNILSMWLLVGVVAFRFPLNFCNDADKSAADLSCWDKLAEWNEADAVRFFTSDAGSSEGESPEKGKEKSINLWVLPMFVNVVLITRNC